MKILLVFDYNRSNLSHGVKDYRILGLHFFVIFNPNMWLFYIHNNFGPWVQFAWDYFALCVFFHLPKLSVLIFEGLNHHMISFIRIAASDHRPRFHQETRQ